jgi:hypothetical protein
MAAIWNGYSPQSMGSPINFDASVRDKADKQHPRNCIFCGVAPVQRGSDGSLLGQDRDAQERYERYDQNAGCHFGQAE